MSREAEVAAAARRWIGTPYRDQASARGAGADCLGLVRGVWRELCGPEPFSMPAYTRDWGEVARREIILDHARRVMVEIPVGGDVLGRVLVFRMRRGAIAKHIGIGSGSARFIHAREGLGVIEEDMTPAWRRRTVAAFSFPDMGGA